MYSIIIQPGKKKKNNCENELYLFPLRTFASKILLLLFNHESTIPVFTNLRCCKMPFLFKRKYLQRRFFAQQKHVKTGFVNSSIRSFVFLCHEQVSCSKLKTIASLLHQPVTKNQTTIFKVCYQQVLTYILFVTSIHQFKNFSREIWCYDYFNDAVKCILRPPQDLEKVR